MPDNFKLSDASGYCCHSCKKGVFGQPLMMHWCGARLAGKSPKFREALMQYGLLALQLKAVQDQLLDDLYNLVLRDPTFGAVGFEKEARAMEQGVLTKLQYLAARLAAEVVYFKVLRVLGMSAHEGIIFAVLKSF